MNNLRYNELFFIKERQAAQLRLIASKPQFLKRIFDIVLSFTVIILLFSWLFPVLAVIIKLNSRGPVFFIQKRVGVNGLIFNCYKFRSMFVNKQANSKQAQENDPRITSIGKFLRKSCLDELPQFFNVLKGDMSIVGPRPHMIKDCEDFAKLVPGYGFRHCVKPGITGMAQVKGYRGETHDYFDVAHRYRWDMFYVMNNSFALDLKIFTQTFTQTIVLVIKGNKVEERNNTGKVRQLLLLNNAEDKENYKKQLVEA